MEFIRELLFHPMTSSFLLIKWTVYLIGLAVLPPIQAEEEDTGVFQIDSATDELSADLLLTGKDSLIGNAQKIKWTILKGENLGEPDKEMGNPAKIKINPYSIHGRKVDVWATTEYNTVKEKEFTVAVPETDTHDHQKVIAHHAKNPRPGKRGTMNGNQRFLFTWSAQPPMKKE